MKKILTIILSLCIVFSLCSCKGVKEERTDTAPVSNSSVSDNSESGNESSEDVQTKNTTIDITSTIQNSEYCDMKYTMSIPDWKQVREHINLTSSVDCNFYTRVYDTGDENLTFYVTEYLGPQKYPGQMDKSYGKSLRTEAEAIAGNLIDKIIKRDTGYSDNMAIYDEYNYITNPDGSQIREFCLQLQRANFNYYYVKGHILVGVKHPIVVYFFDKTEETLYDDEMFPKTLTMLQSIKVEKD